MRRTRCTTWIVAVGIAVVMSLAACGDTDAPVASNSTSPPVDPDTAFAEYEKAVRPLDCSDAYQAMGDASLAGEIGVMKDKAREYRDVVATFDARLGEIAFPDAAEPIVDVMRELLAAELTGLGELAAYDGEDKTRKATVRNNLEADDAVVGVEGNRLREALGHPESTFGVAADLLESADATLFEDLVEPWAKFEAALAANDLAGAKAANAIEIDALQRYIDKLDAIDWPPGSFEGQANTLREHIRGQIEFDRTQTDVAAMADIVRAPEGGTPDWVAARSTFDALWNALMQTHQTARPASKC
jgi:hypothetical protein